MEAETTGAAVEASNETDERGGGRGGGGGGRGEGGRVLEGPGRVWIVQGDGLPRPAAQAARLSPHALSAVR